MKSALYSILLALVILIGLGGCDQSSAPAPSVTMRVLDPTLEPFANMWKAEIGRRFPNAVGVLVHGGDFVEGSWITGDFQYRSGMHVRPVEDVIREAQEAFPGRPVVLLVCNPGHLVLHATGVWYFKNSVFCVPDRFTESPDVTPAMLMQTLLFGMRERMAATHRPTLSRWSDDPDVNGNIFEAVQSEE